MPTRLHLSTALASAAILVSVAAATTASAAPHAEPATNLAPVKAYLLQHTAQLEAFTASFRGIARRYYARAKAADFDYAAMWAESKGSIRKELAAAKSSWIAGNPKYERVEGVVAGTPSLAVYDVVLDAGSSAADDPGSAVPFDLRLRNGKVLRKPGNLFNLTEGMLWGTLPAYVAAKVDLDGDGKREFGEVLPEANVFLAAADAFALYAGKLDASGRAWRPTASDAFTAVVVMTPTMSEYFGQWKVSRFVLGTKATGASFNVVSRLSDIGDILGGLRVIYKGIAPAIASIDPDQSAQTRRELDELYNFVARLKRQEKAGKRFTPEQAELLGRDAQERATAIAGQVTQAAARLKVKIAQ